MATATITPNFTILSTCDTNTGWTGTTTVDSEFYLQGTASVSGTTRTTADRYFTPTSPVDLSNSHIRMWFNFSAPSFLADESAGGISIYLYDGTNTARYYMKGKDTYTGGWTLLTLDTIKTPDSGTINITSVSRVGVTINLIASPRNVVNTWIDYLVYGNSVQITGGTDIDPITLNDIAIADTLSGYGAIQRVNNVYFVSTALLFGDSVGSLNTYFEDSNQLIVFENQPVNANLYKIETLGSGLNTTSFILSNSVMKSANTNYRFDLFFNNTNFTTLGYTNNIAINGDATIFKSGQTVTGSTWTGCNQIITDGASFYNNTIAGSTDSNGALLWPNDTSVYSCSFNDNDYAIQITTASTYTFNNLSFSGNTYDINNTSGGTIVINSTNGSNASSYTGTVVINNAVTLTLTNLIAGTEIRILQAGTNIEVDGIENSTNIYEFTYNYPTGYNVDIVIHNIYYVYIKLLNIPLGATASSIPVQQQLDRWYKNPS